MQERICKVATMYKWYTKDFWLLPAHSREERNPFALFSSKTALAFPRARHFSSFLNGSQHLVVRFHFRVLQSTIYRSGTRYTISLNHLSLSAFLFPCPFSFLPPPLPPSVSRLSCTFSSKHRSIFVWFFLFPRRLLHRKFSLRSGKDPTN